MNQQKLYVAWQCHMGHRMAPMVAASHSEGLQRLHQQVQKATQDSWLLWAQGLGGAVVVLSGTEGVVSVPPRGLPQVVRQRQRFKETLGESAVAVGIGSSIEKALRAREYAAKRGRDAPVLWSQEIDAGLAQIENEDKGLKKAIAENPGTHAGFGGFSRSPPAAAPASPAQEASEHSEGEAARSQALDRSNVPPPPEMTHAADLIDSLHEVAGKADEQKQQGEGKATQDLTATKKKVAEVLQQVRQQAPMLGQLKAAAPDAYASVEALIQSVIALARAMPSVDVKKSEVDVMDGVSDAEAQQLADELKVDLDKIPFEEWKKGVTHEREHADVSTDAKEIAKIAFAHLKESPSYYSDLEACMPLEKKLADVPVGKPIPTPTPVWDSNHDYSHVLSPEHRAAGYSLHVLGSGDQLAARIHHNGQPVGSVLATHHPEKGLEVDVAEVEKGHAGKGLGAAAYESLMAHGKNALGISHVFGGLHSTSASATHAKVAAKHGMDYKPVASELHANPSGPMDGRFGQYAYALKDEIPMEKEEMATRGPRHHLNLPPGTMLQGGPGSDRRRVGKIKVQHGDGSVSWIQARAGMVTGVADRNAKPILGHAGHPLSSRNPTGH